MQQQLYRASQLLIDKTHFEQKTTALVETAKRYVGFRLDGNSNRHLSTTLKRAIKGSQHASGILFRFVSSSAIADFWHYYNAYKTINSKHRCAYQIIDPLVREIARQHRVLEPKSDSAWLMNLYQGIYRAIGYRWPNSRRDCSINYFDRLYFYLLDLEREALEHLGLGIDPEITDRHSKCYREINAVVNKFDFTCSIGHVYVTGPRASDDASAFYTAQSKRIKNEANRIRIELDRALGNTGNACTVHILTLDGYKQAIWTIGGQITNSIHKLPSSRSTI